MVTHAPLSGYIRRSRTRRGRRIPARAIGGIGSFRHDALESRPCRHSRKIRGRSPAHGLKRRATPKIGRIEPFGKPLFARGERPLTPILPVELEQVEQEIAYRLMRRVDMLLQRLEVRQPIR